MGSRRDFFRQAAAFAGGAGWTADLLSAVQRAAAIDPAPGSTFLDAAHVVVLMQENRSFDHAFGTMRGVRGFHDPRAVELPNGNPVWFQSNKTGETYAPFRLDLRKTRITWLGSLPHSWRDQTDARNGGNHDRWLDAKPSGRKECAGMPLTLGYFTREDLPFYHALADAFTVCDHNFCSSLTGTTPNRLYLMTGAIRERPSDPTAPACVRNSDVNYGRDAHWRTFPERLEEAGISWRVYQNEISVRTGLSNDEDDWLANFTDNPLEWFAQYHVGIHGPHLTYLEEAAARLPGEIAMLERQVEPPARTLEAKKRELRYVEAERRLLTADARARIPARERELHARAFTTNTGDPHYRELTELKYNDNGVERTMRVPKGDVLHRFRTDVETGQLPTVSWLIPPSNFSDHPGSPWYGAWYLAEVMNILTAKPEVWKKTIFVLTYDENDGYFDHMPPFVPPDPATPETGAVSAGIDASVEFHPLRSDAAAHPPREARGGPIGLGYRVPMIIASPWSRGGYVCSQTFDHTSVIQLLEKLLSHRTGKVLQETNISAWRRAVCGDLTSAFRPFENLPELPLPLVPAAEFLPAIHKAQFRDMPAGWRACSSAEIDAWRRDRSLTPWMPRQEPGTRPSAALPYDLSAEAVLNAAGDALLLRLAAVGGAGSGFHAYTPGLFRGEAARRTRGYAVSGGAAVEDAWALSGFPGSLYDLRVHGPNGFYREFRGGAADPAITVAFQNRNGEPELVFRNSGARVETAQLVDPTYGGRRQAVNLPPNGALYVRWPLPAGHRWYDIQVTVNGAAGFLRRYAGHVENGRPGISDPAMAQV